MKKLLGLIPLFCLSFQLSANVLEIGLSGGMIKYKLPTIVERSPFYSNPKVSPTIIGSIDILWHIPRTGFSVGIGADMHQLSVKSTYTIPYYYYAGPKNASGITNTTYLARPLVPIYIKLKTDVVNKRVFFLSAGVNAGIVLAPGKHADTTVDSLGKPVEVENPSRAIRSGFGYTVGIYASVGFNITKWLSLGVIFSPRYYNIHSTRIYTYYDVSVNNGTLYIHTSEEKLAYHTFAYPVMLGIKLNL